MTTVIEGHRRAGTLESLSHLHRNFWAGEYALDFYSKTAFRFEKVFLRMHAPMVDELKKAMASGQFHTLCEIGCGAGQVLAHLKDELPDLTRLVGIDLNAAQIQANQQCYHDEPRLQFIAGDALEWIPSHISPGWIFLTYGGVLEYFPQEKLTQLLGTVMAHAPACLALVEPVAEHQDLTAAGPSPAFGMELSYSHPYAALVTAAGLRILWQQDTRLSSGRAVMQISRT